MAHLQLLQHRREPATEGCRLIAWHFCARMSSSEVTSLVHNNTAYSPGKLTGAASQMSL